MDCGRKRGRAALYPFSRGFCTAQVRLGLTMANSTAKTRELSGRQSVVDFERASRRSQDTETLPDNPTEKSNCWFMIAAYPVVL